MPAESVRLDRPVARRDLRAVAILLCACVAALAVGAARAPGGSARPAAQCVQADVPGVLGGGTVRGCGRRAAAVCRAYAGLSATLTAQCGRRPRSKAVKTQ